VKAPAQTIEELAGPEAVRVVLHITGIQAVENVVDAETNPRMFFPDWKPDPAQYLEISRNETRVPQLIARPNEFANLIDG